MLEYWNLQKDLMNVEHLKNFEKKTSLSIRKTFQCYDFHNIFELTTGKNKAENHLLNMELFINEDMYDVAIPVWVVKGSSTFQCDSFVRGYLVYMSVWDPLVGECLKNRKEPTNEMEKTAVAVIRINSYSEDVVAGHVPYEYVQDCIYVPIPVSIVLWTSLQLRNASILELITDLKFQLIFILMTQKRP